MSRKSSLLTLATLCLSLFCFQPSFAASTPSDLVKNFYAQLSDVMHHGDQLGFTGRFKQLEPTIKSSFNLPLMTRFAVGPSWIKAQPAEQQALVQAFSTFSVATYASRFASYDGEKFDVLSEKPASGGGTIVETKLTPKDSEPVTLNYLVRNDENGNPRIVDVFLDATISELATRRSEFSAIIQREGIPALVTTLGTKTKQMGPT